MNKIIIFIALSFCSLFCTAQTSNEKKDIVGTWVSEDDPSWKVVFTTDNLYCQYYEGNVIEKGLYTISNTIPQTEPNIPTGDDISYLKLVDSDRDVEFYEINGVGADNLSITWIENGNLIVFDRQKIDRKNWISKSENNNYKLISALN